MVDKHAVETMTQQRRAREWTQTDLAEQLAETTKNWDEPIDWTQNTVTRLEQGKRRLLLIEAWALALTFNLELAQLIGVDPIDPVVAERTARAQLLLALVEASGLVGGPIDVGRTEQG